MTTPPPARSKCGSLLIRTSVSPGVIAIVSRLKVTEVYALSWALSRVWIPALSPRQRSLDHTIGVNKHSSFVVALGCATSEHAGTCTASFAEWRLCAAL